jgi:hypothetical protein
MSQDMGFDEGLAESSSIADVEVLDVLARAVILCPGLQRKFLSSPTGGAGARVSITVTSARSVVHTRP